MSKLSSHDPFGHFKHKLWPKEGSGVKFDFRPLNIRNIPDFLACGWHTTYCWKALDEAYNFSLDLISIGGLHTKLWLLKVVGVSTLGISRLPLESPTIKCHLGAGPMARHIVYYKGEGGGFPQVWALVSLVNPCFPVAHPCTKMLQVHINQLVVWFVQVCVSD
jgi:hypothetical protein